ncbi:MFS transporter [Ferruginibacter sp. SUN106]|uniref:MFS transporter n=1 Tax=Ferruginibacter sp. SUN106 TaxID=2978348 RepID=UPI003D35B131
MQLQNHSEKRIITKTIWILSLVSMFTDVASEMLYPVMPLFLKQIGFTVIFIGVLEGIAEAVAGLSKPYFGKLSDTKGKRLPFVQLGYGLSAISKPLMAIFVYPLWIFFARTLDRLGKGIRTGARDALLSDEATKETKATVFGFHRSMDTLGAVFGPAITLGYLYFHPHDYKTLFVIAFGPGVLAIVCTLLIKEKPKLLPDEAEKLNPKLILSEVEGLNTKQPGIFSFISYWKNSSPQYKKLVTGLLLFALFNSSDVFLLLKMKESGLNDTAVIGVYIFYNFIYALLAYPAGIIADKLGLKKVFLFGLFIFAIVYAGFAFNNNIIIFVILFALYGLYAAATEGISKAWISNIVDKNETATAIGTYTGFQSIAALLASSICGLLWYNFGGLATFLITASITLVVIIYLSGYKGSDGSKPSDPSSPI